MCLIGSVGCKETLVTSRMAAGIDSFPNKVIRHAPTEATFNRMPRILNVLQKLSYITNRMESHVPFAARKKGPPPPSTPLVFCNSFCRLNALECSRASILP